MYTILMNSDKSLSATNRITIYQREKLVDKIQFLFPQTYEDVSIQECTAMMKYIDQANVAHMEVLSMDDELYKDHIRCQLNVDTKITRFAGDIKLRITFLKINPDNGITEEVLHSGEIILTISPMSDYFAFVSDKSLEVIDQKMAELTAKIQSTLTIAESIDKTKADDIYLDTDHGILYLKANDEKIGTDISLNDLGDTLANYTVDGLVNIITEDFDDNSNNPDDENTNSRYKLALNQEKNELYLLLNDVIVSTIPIKDLSESIIDSTRQEGLTEIII